MEWNSGSGTAGNINEYDDTGYHETGTEYVPMQIGETKGFPFDITTSENVIGLETTCGVRSDMRTTRQLHEQLWRDWIPARTKYSRSVRMWLI